MFCVLGLIFGGVEGVGPVFMFFAPVLIFSGTEGVGSRFHFSRSRTHFRRFRGRLFPFSCFARPYSCSAVPRASGPVIMFCVPGHIFGGTNGVGSRFHVLRARTHFRRCRVRRVPFSYFARPFSFSVIPRASGPVFMFCTLVSRFKGVPRRGSRFHVLLPDSFLAEPWASGPVLMFCASGLFFVVTEGVGLIFMFCAPGLVFGDTEGVGSRFHVLRARTHFRRFRGRRVPFPCFPLPYSFSALPRASGLVFMFCVPRLIFGGTDRVGSRFHVLRSYSFS
jgi:hypothetical protein